MVEDIKALDIVILDMRGLVNFCDFFVICTGTSDRHVRSIAEGIEDGLKELGIKAYARNKNKNMGLSSASLRSDGTPEGSWMLIDLGDVVAHMFEPEARDFYGLEHLWQDAPKVKR